MQREHHRWRSPALGRDVELLIFGWGVARIRRWTDSYDNDTIYFNVGGDK